MRVKIVKCSKKSYWYSNEIGNTFYVIDFDKENYAVCGNSNYILKEDCEAVEGNIEVVCINNIDLEKALTKSKKYEVLDESASFYKIKNDLDVIEYYSMNRFKYATEETVTDNYSELKRILHLAYEQASAGKGKERHANDEPFQKQKIVTLNKQIGSNHGAIFQACKKAQESARLPKDRAIAELLGAINYLAAAVIILEESEK